MKQGASVPLAFYDSSTGEGLERTFKKIGTLLEKGFLCFERVGEVQGILPELSRHLGVRRRPTTQSVSTDRSSRPASAWSAMYDLHDRRTCASCSVNSSCKRLVLPIAPLFSASLACCCCTGSSLSFGGPSSCSDFSFSVAGGGEEFRVRAACDASLRAEAKA